MSSPLPPHPPRAGRRRWPWRLRGLPTHRTGLATVAVAALALAGLLTGVGWRPAPEGGATTAAAEALADLTADTPLTAQFPGLLQVLDEARGLEALHLLLPAGPERRDLERRLGQLRERVAQRLQGLARRVRSNADRDQLATLQARLQAWWQVQDAVLEASRQARRSPGGAVQPGQAATALLTGPSQQAWRALLQVLTDWWQLREPDQAGRARDARHLGEPAAADGSARAQANARLGLVLLLQALALAAGLMAWLPRRQARAADTAAAGLAGADPRGGDGADRPAPRSEAGTAGAPALQEQAWFPAPRRPGAPPAMPDPRDADAPHGPFTPAHHAAARALLESLVRATEPAAAPSTAQPAAPPRATTGTAPDEPDLPPP